MNFEINNLYWQKVDGLIPAIVQDNETQQVLMLGYMNEDALKKTVDDGKVTFWSRTKKRLWQKGETSGNFLLVESISQDCDKDTLLIQAKPNGPTCHTGATSCFDLEEKGQSLQFLVNLYKLIKDRKEKMPEGSYTTSLFQDGLDKIAQKVGEEAVEVVIASKNDSKQLFIEESSDLIFHFLTLLVQKKVTFDEIIQELQKRHKLD